MKPINKEQTAPKAASGPIRVRCIAQEGFAFGNRVRKGMVFTLPDMSHFSERWMELVDPSTPDDLAAKVQPKKNKTRDLAVRTKSGTIVTPAGQGASSAAPADQAGKSEPAAGPTGNQNVLGD